MKTLFSFLMAFSLVVPAFAQDAEQSVANRRKLEARRFLQTNNFEFTQGSWGFYRDKYDFNASVEACIARYENRYNIMQVIVPNDKESLPLLKLTSKSGRPFIGGKTTIGNAIQLWYMRREGKNPAMYALTRDFQTVLDFMKAEYLMTLDKIFVSGGAMDKRVASIDLDGLSAVLDYMSSKCLNRDFFLPSHAKVLELLNSQVEVTGRPRAETNFNRVSNTTEAAIGDLSLLVRQAAGLEKLKNELQEISANAEYKTQNTERETLERILKQAESTVTKGKAQLAELQSLQKNSYQTEQEFKKAAEAKASAEKAFTLIDSRYQAVNSNYKHIESTNEAAVKAYQEEKQKVDEARAEVKNLRPAAINLAQRLGKVREKLFTALNQASKKESDWRQAKMNWVRKSEMRDRVQQETEKRIGHTVASLQTDLEKLTNSTVSTKNKMRTSAALACSLKEVFSEIKQGQFINRMMRRLESRGNCVAVYGETESIVCLEEASRLLSMEIELTEQEASLNRSNDCAFEKKSKEAKLQVRAKLLGKLKERYDSIAGAKFSAAAFKNIVASEMDMYQSIRAQHTNRIGNMKNALVDLGDDNVDRELQKVRDCKATDAAGCSMAVRTASSALLQYRNSQMIVQTDLQNSFFERKKILMRLQGEIETKVALQSRLLDMRVKNAKEAFDANSDIIAAESEALEAVRKKYNAATKKLQNAQQNLGLAEAAFAPVARKYEAAQAQMNKFREKFNMNNLEQQRKRFMEEIEARRAAYFKAKAAHEKTQDALKNLAANRDAISKAVAQAEKDRYNAQSKIKTLSAKLRSFDSKLDAKKEEIAEAEAKMEQSLIAWAKFRYGVWANLKQ